MWDLQENSGKEISEAGRRAQWLRKTFFFHFLRWHTVRLCAACQNIPSLRAASHLLTITTTLKMHTWSNPAVLALIRRALKGNFNAGFTPKFQFSTQLCRLISRQFEHLLLQVAATGDCDISRHPFLHDKVETCTVMWCGRSCFVKFSCKRWHASFFFSKSRLFTWMRFASALRSDEPGDEPFKSRCCTRCGPKKRWCATLGIKCF